MFFRGLSLFSNFIRLTLLFQIISTNQSINQLFDIALYSSKRALIYPNFLFLSLYFQSLIPSSWFASVLPAFSHPICSYVYPGICSSKKKKNYILSYILCTYPNQSNILNPAIISNFIQLFLSFDL